MKRHFLLPTAILVVLGLSTYGQQPAKRQKFIELANFDSSVKPGDNFYLYVNGKWIKNTAIPPTETRIGSFLDVYNVTKEHVKGILETVSKGGEPMGSIEQKVGDFYASGMDSVTIEKRGYEPIKPTLQEIDGITDVKGVVAFIAKEQTKNTDILYAPYVGSDDKNSSMNILGFYQSGIGLPDRDYYFKTDADYKKYRETGQVAQLRDNPV